MYSVTSLYRAQSNWSKTHSWLSWVMVLKEQNFDQLCQENTILNMSIEQNFNYANRTQFQINHEHNFYEDVCIDKNKFLKVKKKTNNNNNKKIYAHRTQFQIYYNKLIAFLCISVSNFLYSFKYLHIHIFRTDIPNQNRQIHIIKILRYHEAILLS